MNSSSHQANRSATLKEIDSLDLDAVSGGAANDDPFARIENLRIYISYPRYPALPGSLLTRGQDGVLLLDGIPQW